MFINKSLEHFSVDSDWLKSSGGLRLDASFYNPRAAQAIETLKKSGLLIKTLGEVTQEIFIPPRFKRIYVTHSHGVPFLQGSHVVHFQPADLKYLSRTAHRNLSKWLISEGWILVTCSGTIGRVAITPQQWDGWAASQHIMRIIPQIGGPCPPGYLYAYLSSPLGQAQLTAQIYGAVVDELTEGQAGRVLVPVAVTEAEKREVRRINDLALESMRKRAEAADMASQSVSAMTNWIPTAIAEEHQRLQLIDEPQLTPEAPSKKRETG